jgi:hypothetical protein
MRRKNEGALLNFPFKKRATTITNKEAGPALEKPARSAPLPLCKERYYEKTMD